MHTSETIGQLLDSAAGELVRLQQHGPSSVMPNLSRGLDDVRRGLDDVRRGLDDVRRRLDDVHQWSSFCTGVLRAHPIHEIFLEDPFTRHSFIQPRGYPGDAELLDYIYGHKGANGSSPFGKALFNYTRNVPSSAAVRERRNVIAKRIDRTAEQFSSARILALAAGHLREAELSNAIQSRCIGELIAFDQDAKSLSLVTETYGNHQLVTQQGSIRSLLGKSSQFAGFHFVYAAGLFDYLADRTAARLTKTMFDALAPGGTVLVANFAPSLNDIGYMEAYMRWHLIYRDEAQMKELMSEIDPIRIANYSLYSDSSHCMFFLEIERA
jgi:hypothetical protein